MIDRPIRPLFPDGYFNEVQILSSVISADQDNDPDVLAMIGASAALAISKITVLPVSTRKMKIVMAYPIVWIHVPLIRQTDVTPA